MKILKSDIVLKEAQKEGIKWLVSKKCAGLCFSTGLGKTADALFASEVVVRRTDITYINAFVTKAAVKAFIDDIDLHFHLKWNIPHETGKHLPHPYVNLIQYNVAERIMDQIRNSAPSIFIMDEIQSIKNPDAKTRLVFDRLRPCAEYLFALTATPIANHIEDLYWISHYIWPGFFGTFWEFRSRYCVMKKKRASRNGRRYVYYEITDYKNLKELREKVRLLWLVRSEYMEKKFKYISLPPLKGEDEADYLKAAKGILDETKDIKEFVARMPGLQRVVDMTKFKMEVMRDIIQSLHDKGEGVLVFFALKEPIKYLQAQFPFDIEVLTGDTTQKNRFRIKDEFCAGKILFCTKAASRSYNFQAVGTVLFYTVPFEIEAFAQMIGRIARPFISKYEYVDVLVPYVKDSIDEYRVEMMKTNAWLVKQILEDGGSPNLPAAANAKRRKAIIALRKKLVMETEEVMLSKEQTNKIIKAYFGPWGAKPSLPVVRALMKFNQTRSGVIIAPVKYHNQVISQLLILGGKRKSYEVKLSHDLIDIYLGLNEEVPSLSQVQVPYLFVRTLRREMPNAQRWNILSMTVLGRGPKPTYIITDMANEMRMERFQEVSLKVRSSKEDDLF